MRRTIAGPLAWTSLCLLLSTAALPDEPASAGLERQEIRAQLMPARYATLVAEVGARVSAVPTAEGGSFARGALLVSFDCSVQDATLRKARAERRAAADTLAANRKLFDLKSISKLELDLSDSALERASAEVGVQEAILAKCRVTAPYAGRVAEQKVREQQFVQPGQPLLDILDDSSLEIEFLVPSSWLRWLKPGLPFAVSIDETGKDYPAPFTRIGARVDPVSQSVKVAAAIDGTFPELIAGMSGRVRISPPGAQP